MTPTASNHPMRRTGDRWIVRCFRFVSAPLVDGNSGRLSITRILAIADTILAWHILEEKHELSGTVLALLIMAMAAAFGKSTFGFFLTRYEMKNSLAESVNITHATTVTHDIKEIIDRRNGETGIEATP